MTVMEQKRTTSYTIDLSTLVVPVDFSALSWRVLPLAAHLARRLGADLKPIHVDTASPWRDAGTDGDAAPLRLRATPFGRPVDVNVIAAGEAADGIVTFARAHQPALVAMSAHGYTGLGELAFGSVSEQVLRSTSESMLTVGPRFEVARQAFVRRIVACVDLTAGGDVIVPEALAWAKTLDVPFELVTVLTRHATSDAAMREEAAEFERFVDELNAIDPRVTGLVLDGPRPAHEIVKHISALRGTLVAMATHARPPMARTLVGSTVAAVTRHSPAGLLLCRRS